MQLTGFLPAAKSWWWLLSVSALVAGVAGYAVVSLRAPRYVASVELLVGPINTDLDTIRAAGQLAQTYAQIASSQPLLDETARVLGLAGVAKGDVRAFANDVTRVVTVQVRSESAVEAAAVANRLADGLAALAAQGTSRPEGELQVIDRAAPPSSPDAANAVLLAVLAGLAGLLGSFTIVLLVEYLRNTVASAGELAELSGVVVLGSLDGARRGGALVVESAPDSSAAAAYRLLATEVEFSGSRSEPGLRSLLVLGAQGGEGAGEVAANLAGALAGAGRRVTLVDANPLEGEITVLLGFSERLGMAELARHAELLEQGDEVLRHFRLSYAAGIDVLPRGGQGGGELVEPLRVGQLLERLLEECDLVVVNAAPLHRSPGALVWARAVDGSLLVAAKDQTRRERVSRASESLRLVGATLIGTVLNGRRGRAASQGASESRRGRPHEPEPPAGDELEVRRSSRREPTVDEPSKPAGKVRSASDPAKDHADLQ